MKGNGLDSRVYSDLQAHEVMKELETEKRREEKENRSLDDGRDVVHKACVRIVR
jgi:hypothetical protein